MATGIIQANSEAKNKAVKSLIKGSSGGHKGTHQIIVERSGLFWEATSTLRPLQAL
jgi:hypothetical protein